MRLLQAAHPCNVAPAAIRPAAITALSLTAVPVGVGGGSRTWLRGLLPADALNASLERVKQIACAQHGSRAKGA